MFASALDSALERWFAYVDIALAQLLLQSSEKRSQDVICFISYLSMATRHGHLCIYVDSIQVNPHPSTLFQEDETGQKFTDEELNNLAACIMRGATELPDSIVSSNSTSITPICREGMLYYLQRYWLLETQCLRRLQQLLVAAPFFKIDEAFAENYTHTLVRQGHLLPEQAQVILRGCNRSLAIVCGGPGTGKTYTAAHGIALYWNALSPEQRRRAEIVLAAPTGKAAANLQKSLSKVVDTLEQFKPLQAKTLHALLGVYSQQPHSVSADLIIVDESSMIDVQLMALLLNVVKSGARLILLGDPHQLPPVEVGGIFKDIVEALKKYPGSEPLELKTCMRVESQDLLVFAQGIREGTLNEKISCIDLDNTGSTVVQRQHALLKYCMRHYEISEEIKANQQRLFEHFNRFRVLTPLRKGPFGVDALNDYFAQMHKNAYAVPIMITRNMAELNLYNGDVGVLVQPEGYALFEGGVKGVVRKISVLLLPPYEYAYCLSVHKSQGSEFEHVLLLMPEGAEVFGREVLYTAVTRAKKELDIWASANVVQQALAYPSQRLSGISQRFSTKTSSDLVHSLI